MVKATHSGAIDPTWGNYQYLTDIANAAIKKFPGMRITSGQRNGDPHHHGRRQAIDIAYPARDNGNSKYFEVANWIFENHPNEIAYVITQGMVRDRDGYSGTGKSGKWVRWPDGDHYDHLHLSGLLGPDEIVKGVNKMPLNGIDISSWQGNIDVAKVPCDFVIIKATGGGSGSGGRGYVNPYCDSRFQAAKKAGKLLGVYHYAHEIGFQGNAVDEADFFLKNAKGYLNGDAIPILDWESDNKLDVAWALAWLKRVEERTGIKPWFYTYTNILNSADFSPIAKAGYGLWIANYNPDITIYGYKQPNPPFSRGFDITACFQYSRYTRLTNYNGDLDANVFYGDAKAWRAYATPKGKQPVENTPTEEKPKVESKPTTPPKTEEGGINVKTITTTADNVKLRSAAKVANNVIAELPKGSTVKINDIVIAGGIIWGVQPRANNKKGYIDLGKQFGWIK